MALFKISGTAVKKITAKELDLHETANLVSIIQELAKTDINAKAIIKTLIDKNPSKYWSLKDK